MSLADGIHSLADETLARLDEAREYYLHCRQAWRLVLQLARKGRPVGIVDLATKRQLPVEELEERAYRYDAIHLNESTFRRLPSLLEDWVLGLIRLWLTTYPEDLDLNFDPATGQRQGRKRKSRSHSLGYCTLEIAARFLRVWPSVSFET